MENDDSGEDILTFLEDVEYKEALAPHPDDIDPTASVIAASTEVKIQEAYIHI